MSSSFRGGLPPAKRYISANSIRLVLLSVVFVCGLLTLSLAGHTQTPQTARGVIRLKVRYKSGEVTKELPRKRFFLIKGSLDENKSLAEMIRQTTVTSRSCYYRSQARMRRSSSGSTIMTANRFIAAPSKRNT
jgi:hypothetical protein